MAPSGLEADQVIVEHVILAPPLPALDHPALEIVLGAGDPENTAPQEVEEMGEVHIGLVKEHAFAGPQARTDLAGALVVVVLGGVNEGEGR